MKADSAKYEFTLDNQFFVDLDGPEVQKGKLAVELNVKKTSGVFLLDFQTEGFVIVPCDRCLDEMELPVSTSDKLKVKLGSSFAEEGEWHVYHTVCGACGYYRGKLAIEKEAAV